MKRHIPGKPDGAVWETWSYANQKTVIAEWARRNPYLRVFGSRAKGCAREDSDLDIAITAEDAHYFNLAATWEAELSEITELRVVVRRYNTELVRRYCDDFSILMFEQLTDKPQRRRVR